MKIINANAQYLDPTGMHPYAFMERVGRTCYKSEDKITDVSAVKFISALKNNKHTAMLEHAHIILTMSKENLTKLTNALAKMSVNKMSKNSITPYLNITINDNGTDGNYISGSFRTFINLFSNESNDITLKHKNIQSILFDNYPEVFDKPDNYDGTTGDVKLLSREEFETDVQKAYPNSSEAMYVIRKHMVHTVLFICDRGVTHEFVRHRPASFAQESTRYCNYSHDKFGNEITVIKPYFYEEGTEAYELWKAGCEHDEEIYFKLLAANLTPQQARDNLPTSVKTELVITATENEWQHIINLRYSGTTGAPHPQMLEVMTIIHDDLMKAAKNRIA